MTTSQEPLVSVLIPVRNGMPWLEQAVESVRSQTYERLEVVVSDNASTDDTRRYLLGVARRDRRVRLILGDVDVGPTGNFERLYDETDAAFVKYVMADDVLRRDNVDRLLQPLLRDSDIVLSTSRRACVDADLSPLPDIEATTPLWDQDAVVPGTVLGDIALERCSNVIGEPTTVLFRRSAAARFNRFGNRSFRVNADVATWLSLLRKGSAAYTAEPLSFFRIHPAQDQRSPEFVIKGWLEWHELLMVSRSSGYLASRRRWQRAHLRWLRGALASAARSRSVPIALTSSMKTSALQLLRR